MKFSKWLNRNLYYFHEGVKNPRRFLIQTNVWNSLLLFFGAASRFIGFESLRLLLNFCFIYAFDNLVVSPLICKELQSLRE